MERNTIQSLFAVTEVGLVYRNKIKPSERRQIQKSGHAYDLLLLAWDMNKIQLVEEFKILLLDRRNACIGISTVSTGGITGTLADPKVIFATALKTRSTGLILSHNHPSGNVTPSSADLETTRQLATGGKILGISIMDHLIVTPRSYYSFADEGVMPS